jgi:hypothetical protein
MPDTVGPFDRFKRLSVQAQIEETSEEICWEIESGTGARRCPREYVKRREGRGTALTAVVTAA